jgi:hypothetical protein
MRQLKLKLKPRPGADSTGTGDLDLRNGGKQPNRASAGEKGVAREEFFLSPVPFHQLRKKNAKRLPGDHPFLVC